MSSGTETLPFVIGVPHGGRDCPSELTERTRLLDHDLFEDSDAFTDRIYDVTGRVLHTQIGRIARAYVDLNRAPDDLPPENPDGVIKSVTDHEVPVYSAGDEPEPALIAHLITQYHRPYHDALSAAAVVEGVLLGLDCHSMESYGPPIAPDRDRERPMFCISNAKGATCPDEILESLGDAIARAFDLDRHAIVHNAPFQGGWTIRHHAEVDDIPWIQIEMNRSLYLGYPWFDETRLRVSGERIGELNRMFLRALQLLARERT